MSPIRRMPSARAIDLQENRSREVDGADFPRGLFSYCMPRWVRLYVGETGKLTALNEIIFTDFSLFAELLAFSNEQSHGSTQQQYYRVIEFSLKTYREGKF